ncbi:two-component response regulator ORR29 [Flavobacteriaceae bacterium UJ101]|nr:two-component response regulator ORR29 [Flavobacteriaceae bacterium UJ101]
MKKIKLLLIDDHQLFLDGLVSILEGEPDIEIIYTTSSAKEALHFIQNTTSSIDLIITDIAMPEMNGIEFIKAIKQFNKATKILVLSMFENMHSYQGINGYLLKETSQSKVIEAIRGIVYDGKTYLNYTQEPIEEYIFSQDILTKREKEVVHYIAKELTNEEIAKIMFISLRTVQTHRKNILFKLGAKNTAGLIKRALHLGIIK